MRQLEVRFHVDSGLLFELGEQLVARRSIALAELIKNAYDADAQSVTISFIHVTEPGGEIVISDTGTGMTLDDIDNYWMRVGTTHKVTESFSPKYGRPRTGAKGIGRFAARRLSRVLQIESVAQVDEGSWERVNMTIDWDQISSGTDLSELTLNCTTKSYTSEQDTGVTLRLVDVREAWTAEDIDEVSSDLEGLIPPFSEELAVLRHSIRDNDVLEGGGLADPGFQITIQAEEFPSRHDQILSNSFLSSALLRLTGHVDSSGSVSLTLKIRGQDDAKTFVLPQRFPLMGKVLFVVHWFVFASNYFEGGSMAEARKLGRNYGGVKIYSDGFRVFPYGSTGDDWLGLDEARGNRRTGMDPSLRSFFDGPARARPMLSLPSNSQLFGAVLTSRQLHPSLIANISRERFIENEGYDQLRSMVRMAIHWMTIEYTYFQQTRKKEKPSSEMEPRAKVSASELVREKSTEIQTIVKEAVPAALQASVMMRLNERLKEISVRVEENEKEFITKLAMLRILASAGTSVVIFNHQLRAIVDGLRRFVHDLGPEGSQVDLFLLSEIDNLRRDSSEWLGVVQAQARQLGFLLGNEARTRRKKLVLFPIVSNMIDTFSAYCRDHGITITNAIPAHVRTPPMYEAEVSSVLLNLLTNALKSVKQEPKREIEIEAHVDGASLALAVKDTGIGVDLSINDRYFEPFFTTSAPDPILGVGTGLGLSIVRDIVLEHNGDIRFVEVNEPWNTCVKITLPFGVDD